MLTFSESVVNAQLKFVDLPDDCVVMCMLSMSVKDIMRMRLTCRRMSYITRFECMWTVMFRRTAGPGLVDYLRVLDDASRHLLEPFAIYADTLSTRRSTSIHREGLSCSLGPWPLPLELTSSANRQHLSSDARWFVEVRGRWKVRVWDLLYRRVYVESDDMCAEAPAAPSSSAFHLSEDAKRLHVIVHGVRAVDRVDRSRARSNKDKVWESVMYLWTQDVPSQNMLNDPLIFPPNSPYSRSIRWLPRVQIRSCDCSSLDLNESWLSYYVHDSKEIVVTEWTFGLDDPQERRCKGVILSCPELLDSGSLTPVWTRISAGKDQRYLVWMNSAGTILLFAMPSLEVAPSSVLSTVSVKPIARLDLPFSTIELITPMRPLVSRDDGPFIFSLVSEQTCFTVIVEIAPSPRMYLFSRMLPTIPNQRHQMSNCRFDPTGTLGIYFAQGTKQPSAAKLWAVTAWSGEESHRNYRHRSSFSASSSSPSRSSSLSSSSVSSFGSYKLPQPCQAIAAANKAYMKQQIGPSVLGWFEHVVFDEVSGLVCSSVVTISQPNEPHVREYRLVYHPEIKYSLDSK